MSNVKVVSVSVKKGKFSVISTPARVLIGPRMYRKAVQVRGEGSEKFAVYSAGGQRGLNQVLIFDHRPLVVASVGSDMETINGITNTFGNVVVVAKTDNGKVVGYHVNIYPLEASGDEKNISALFSVARYYAPEGGGKVDVMASAHWSMDWVWENSSGKAVTQVVAVTSAKKIVRVYYSDGRSVFVGGGIRHRSAEENAKAKAKFRHAERVRQHPVRRTLSKQTTTKSVPVVGYDEPPLMVAIDELVNPV